MGRSSGKANTTCSTSTTRMGLFGAPSIGGTRPAQTWCIGKICRLRWPPPETAPTKAGAGRGAWSMTGFPSITGHDSADFRDPYVWREGDRWLLLIGAGRRERGGMALLYESDDLRRWRYLRPALAGVVGTDCNMWECPVLLRSGNRCV